MPADGLAAFRRRPYRRDDHQYGRYPQRRDEGEDYRPRGPQHSGVREGDRRGRDHRRHARRGYRERVRHDPTRGRPIVAEQVDRRRSDSSFANRGNCRRTRRGRWSVISKKSANKLARRPRSTDCTSESSICWAGCSSAPAIARTCLRHSIEVAFLAGNARRRDRLGRKAGPTLWVAARYRQGGRSRGRRRPSEDRRRSTQTVW